MKKTTLSSLAATFLCAVAAVSLASNDFPAPSEKMLVNYYTGLARKYADEHHQKVLALRAPADWQAMRTELLSSYKRMLGPFPKRTPLNARIRGKIERSEATIEKIIFESRPGFYVTSSLYLPPRKLSKPVPAVLIVSGHWQDAKGDGPHRELGLTLAKNGIVAFVIDPLSQGERVAFPDAQGKFVYVATTEHSMQAFPCWLTGTNLAHYFVWDMMRAIDYLETRPEVDRKRIALTGASGGGLQTALATPVEPRVQFAAPTVYLSDSAMWMAIGSVEDGEQSIYGSLQEGINHATLMELAAPRPYQIQSAEKDYFPIEGTRKSVAEAKKVYDLLGVADRLRMVQYPGEHGYPLELRSFFYEALNTWLVHSPNEISETPVEVNTKEELLCTPTGQVKTSVKYARGVAYFNNERAKAIMPHRALPKNEAGLAKYQTTVRDAMRDTLPMDVPGTLPAVSKSTEAGQSAVKEVYWLRTEPGITVPAVIVRPTRSGPLPAVLLISENGNGDAEVAAVQERLASHGILSMNVDLRGIGASSPGPLGDPTKDSGQFYVTSQVEQQSQNAMKCGTSMFQGRLLDGTQCLNYLRSRQDVDPKRIAVIGWGECGTLALTLAALDPQVAACADVGGLTTYYSLTTVDIPFYPASVVIWDVLAHYDLPETAACVAPRPLLLAGLRGPLKETSQQADLEKTYSATTAAYRAGGAAQSLQLSPEMPDVAEWLIDIHLRVTREAASSDQITGWMTRERRSQ